MDLLPTNIVVGPNEEYAKIIDLGHCSLRDDVPGEEFERLKRNDLRYLKEL